MLIKIANAVKGLKCSVVGQQVAMKTDKTIDFIVYHCFWSRLKKLSIVSLLFKTGYIASF